MAWNDRETLNPRSNQRRPIDYQQPINRSTENDYTPGERMGAGSSATVIVLLSAVCWLVLIFAYVELTRLV